VTTGAMSRVATIARRLRRRWSRRRAGGRRPAGAPAAGSAHRPVVLSHHRTSEGVVTYTRCGCGDLRVWLTGRGGSAGRLVKAIRGRARPPGCHQ
jgi:hypothetical protein